MQAAIEMHHAYARFMAPFTEAILEATALAPRDRVLDVGCGTGDTTIEAARAVPDGFAHGVDREPQVIAFARGRALGEGLAQASFCVADAGVHVLDAGGFDHVISRNGTLHFQDPVRAHANLRRALRGGGQLTATAPRSPDHNPWFTTMMRAIHRVTGPPGPRRTDHGSVAAGGPFVLADADRIFAILTEAGWHDVGIEPYDTALCVGADVDDALAFFAATDGAPLRRALDEGTWSRVMASLADALAPHATPNGVYLGASSWVVTARA